MDGTEKRGRKKVPLFASLQMKYAMSYLVIFAVVLALALLTDLSPVVFVALAAAAGIVVQNLIRRNG